MRSSRRRVGRIGLSLAALPILLLVSSCGSENSPTSAEAGRALKAHILAALKAQNAQDIVVADPGGKNIACGNNRAKQTFAATGHDLSARSDPEALNNMLLGALEGITPYKVVSADAKGQPIRVVNETTKTTISFNSPGDGTYSAVGETDCLPVS